MESLPPPPTIHCTDCSNFAHFWPCLPTFPTDIWRLLAALGGFWPPLPSFGGSKPLSVAFGTRLDALGCFSWPLRDVLDSFWPLFVFFAYRWPLVIWAAMWGKKRTSYAEILLHFYLTGLRTAHRKYINSNTLVCFDEKDRKLLGENA